MSYYLNTTMTLSQLRDVVTIESLEARELALSYGVKTA